MTECLKTSIFCFLITFCVVYLSSNSGNSFTFDFLSPNIEQLLVLDQNYHVTILDFKIYDQKWLIPSSDTSVLRREAEELAMNNLC